MPEGRATDEQDGGERGCHRKAEHAPVERKRCEPGELRGHDRAEQLHAPEGDDQSDGAAEQTEHAGFQQAAVDQMAWRSAECQAHGGLMAATGETREHEVGKVGTRGEQQEADGGGQHQVKGADFAGDVFAQRRRKGADVGVAVGVFALEPGGDGLEIGVGLGEGDAGLEATGDEKVVAMAAFQGFGVVEGAERNPKCIGLSGNGEGGRHDADHGVGRAAELHGAADDVWVLREAALPETVAEHDGLGGAGEVFAFGPEAAGGGLCLQCAEEAGCDESAGDLLGIAGAGEEHAAVFVEADFLKRAVLGAPVGVVGHRHRTVVHPEEVGLFPDGDEAVGLGEGQRAQQGGIDHAEDRGIGPDRQRKRGDDHGGETGCPEECAKDVAEIEEHGRKSEWRKAQREIQAASLGAECDHGVDAGGAAGGDPAGDKGDGEQRQGGGEVREAIHAGDAEELALKELRAGQGTDAAEHGADQHEDEA